jgi:glycosyltransferase involved in cell wall biosynthesis
MPKPIRVLELRSVRGTGGGPEKTILLGAERADRDRFAVTVCYIRDRRDEAFHPAERAARMAVDYVEIHERHSFDVRVWPALVRLTRDRSIDIVHAHEYKTDLLALLLARRTGAVPIATAHGWTGQSWRESRVYYPLDKRLLARFPRVVAVSSEIRRELERRGARADRITVILNAIDPQAFRRDASARAAVRASLGLPADAVAIGAVGRLERQKRFDLLLEAFAAAARTRPHLRLVIAGDGSLREELAATARGLGVSAACALLGHRDDVAALHQAFDLFVQSSEYEGTPNAVLEAMAMETPLVATDVGGTRELAIPGLHGLIVPPRDARALEAAVVAALDDPAAARARARAARDRIETELSFEARTRRLERVYDQLVAERGASRSVPHA